jgi:AcrR family transcriptional regulator
MPYPAGHRAQVKRKIIESARRLFNRNGFENVSLQQIMAGAGLTPRRILQLLQKQERPLCRSSGMLLH